MATYGLINPSLNANAYVDSRQDNRTSTVSYANSYTYAPIIAYENASVWGNSAEANSTAKTSSEQRQEDGITGKNIQTVAVVAVLATAAVVGGVILLKK